MRKLPFEVVAANIDEAPRAEVAARRPFAPRIGLSRIVPRAAGFAAALAAATAVTVATAEQNFPTPLPPDRMFQLQALPEQYPQDWAFLEFTGDKMELRDISGRAYDVKGQLASFESGMLLIGHKRPELYVADTVWARGNRGARTDFITIYDKRTFAAIGEIVLPGGKRARVEPLQGMFAFTDDERLALVFNFTPASSVTVVDLVRRKVLSEIEIPGCMLIYPTGPRGFSTLCASGTLLSVQLDAQGKAIGRSETKRFNPLDSDPLYTASALVHGVRYFPSLNGRVQPIDLRGATPAILPEWSLVTTEDTARNWRPSGQQLIAGAEDGSLYVIMRPDGHEGTHKEAGTEVWVYDVASHLQVRRIALQRPAVTIETTRGPDPVLLAATEERLDVYKLHDGSFLRSFGADIENNNILIQAAD